MSDRRPSLIDQMAMVAASQMLLEGLSDSSDDSSLGGDVLDNGIEEGYEDQDDDGPTMVFNSALEADDENDSEIDQDDDDDGADGEDDFFEHNYEQSNNLDHLRRQHHPNAHHQHQKKHGDDASAPSHVGSEEEELDEFGDNPMPLDYGYSWQPRDSAELELEDSIQFNSSASELVSSEDLSLEEGPHKARRASFKQPMRRASYQSIHSMQSLSDTSFNSAPARTGTNGIVGEDGIPTDYGDMEGLSSFSRMERRRPLSIAVPNAAGATMSRRSSARRSSVKIRNALGEEDTAAAAAAPQLQPSPSSRTASLLGFNRRSTRRQNLSIQVRSGAMGSLDNAIESLRKQDSNSEWENVAAAVTVVAAGSQAAGSAKSRHIKFAVNDTVLVFLTLLNVTNMDDPKDTFTIAPVNKYGYPQGEGTSEQEKAGPYTFVLATVKHVHFDEDDRYYTVIRADTGTEQRADSGWMEPVSDPYGIDAASRAAKRTVRSTRDKPIEEEEQPGYLQNFMDHFVFVASWPTDFFRSTLLPWYCHQRVAAKRRVTQLLYGDSPFSCKIRITGINILVFCSFVFLFLEVINLGFLPGTVDDEVAIVGVVVWSVLVLELLFEMLIRPPGYMHLIESDKAFAPSTARYINRFHLLFETIGLLTFIPEFRCLLQEDVCNRDSLFSRVRASTDAVLGDTHADAARGRFLLGITALRFFGVVRHWKQMWINNTFRPVQVEGIVKLIYRAEGNVTESGEMTVKSKKNDDNDSVRGDKDENDHGEDLASTEEDQRLKNAATIGTALMVVNSQRALILLTSIVIVLPLLGSLTQQNLVATETVELLQANNIAAALDDCDYLESAVASWANIAAVPQPASLLTKLEDTYVLWAQLLPVRCDFQRDDGVLTYCSGDLSRPTDIYPCTVWDDYAPDDAGEATEEYFADALGIRLDGVREISREGIDEFSDYSVSIIYNDNITVSLANMGLFYLLLGILIMGLYGLQALRGDAIRLVLDPLQRMLKIVLRYAENPLSQDVKGSRIKKDDDSVQEHEEIGNYETEQLINAITKIADLLRKCWGVAGAGIISSNLARTKDGKTVVFNPTVPGKRVYALFGFVAINGFSEQLRALDRDVMILINDVAKVVHDEVYRWALGDHGQCNKNLGSAFLMVFRIGDFSEVHKKKQVATEKLFRDNGKNSGKRTANLRRRTRVGTRNVSYGRKNRGQEDGQLQLASLPGIQTFTDRALLGMLKSFAGIHRDKNLQVWKNDFRLSAGVSAYHVDIIYGMDAGWAVEGAVGSEYKIDATYLSPHVNMASRMMSATKQYGVTILLSKAVEELLSRTCRKKLRHLDTVYVKGSKVKQDIFTYDARHKGVDFFLIERTPEQADMEAESYTHNIWDHDQDLRAMRQHVSDEFMEVFSLAVKQYLAGNWKEAYKNFEQADNTMIETVLEDGYLEYDLDELEGRIFNKNDKCEDIERVRQDLGDGASRVLMAYMERRNLTPPADWNAVRQLSSK